MSETKHVAKPDGSNLSEYLRTGQDVFCEVCGLVVEYAYGGQWRHRTPAIEEARRKMRKAVKRLERAFEEERRG